MTSATTHAGVYPAPLTPMNTDLSPDIPRYLDHCQRLLDAGCHGLMPLGTTGEAHSFTVKERCGIMDALAGSGLPVDRMFIGTGALAYPDTITLTRYAVSIGAGGVCIQPPFYYKPVDTEGLLQFYAKIIEGVASDALRMYVYDYEPNIHVHHSLEFFDRLFKQFPENAAGLKDSTGDAELLTQRCEMFPGRVWVGVDALSLTGYQAGAVGTMSSTSNIMPHVTKALYEKRDTGAAQQLQDQIRQVVSELGPFSRLPALKTIVGWQSDEVDWDQVRPPLRRLNVEEKADLQKRMEALGLLSTQDVLARATA